MFQTQKKKNLKFCEVHPVHFLIGFIFEHPGEGVLANIMPCWQDTILSLIRTVLFHCWCSWQVDRKMCYFCPGNNNIFLLYAFQTLSLYLKPLHSSLVEQCYDFLYKSLVIVTIHKEKFLFSVCGENDDSLLMLTSSCLERLCIYSFMYAVVTSVKNPMYIEVQLLWNLCFIRFNWI